MINQPHAQTVRDLAEQAQFVLMRAGRVLLESLDYRMVLQDVAQLVVPAVADVCLVDLVENHQVVPGVIWHVDPAKVDWIRQWRLRHAVIPSQSAWPHVVQVASNQEPMLYEDLSDEHLQQLAQDEQHLRTLRDLDMRSALIVPLTAHGRPLGVMTLMSRRSGWFSQAAMAPIQELADRCALALNHTRLHRDLQQSLRESEEHFRILFGQAAVGVGLVTLQHRLSQVNSRFCQITGYSEPELLAMTDPLEQLTYPGDLAADRHHLTRLLQGELTTYQMEKRYLRKDGKIVWVELIVSPLRDAQGRIQQAMGVVNDITARKQVEQALSESEYRFRAIVDQAAVGIMQVNPEERIVLVNDRYCEIAGYRREELIGRTLEDITFPEDLEWFRAVIRRLFQGQASSVSFERRYLRRDGKPRWVRVNASAIRDDKGRIRYMQGVVEDIHRRKRAEDALRHSQERLRELNETLEQRVAERTAELQQRAAQLQALASQLTQVEQRERRRLADVLHDHLQQLLAAGKLQLGAIIHRLGDPWIRSVVQKVDRLLSESLEVSRTLTVELSPPILYEQGLVPALNWLVPWMQEKYALTVHLEVGQPVDLVDDNLCVVVFQAVRELLFNAVKHAGVQEAWVHLRRQDDAHLEITVTDHGRGFDPDQIQKRQGKDGFGLFSIHERLEVMGGRIQIISRPGQGTRVVLRLPLKDRSTPWPPAA